MPMVSLDMMLWKRPSCPNICKLDSFSLRASGASPSHSPRSRSSCRTFILLKYCRRRFVVNKSNELKTKKNGTVTAVSEGGFNEVNKMGDTLINNDCGVTLERALRDPSSLTYFLIWAHKVQTHLILIGCSESHSLSCNGKPWKLCNISCPISPE